MDNEKLFDYLQDAAEQLTEALFGDRSWPDAAFIIEHGAEKDENGKTLQKYRHLVHHSKTATSPTDNGSVDLPHLRNALARCNQVKPIKESAAGFRKRARAHLDKHANVLLKTRKEQADYDQIKALFDEFNIEIEKE